MSEPIKETTKAPRALRLRYVVALVVVGAVAIFSQLLVQRSLARSEVDSRVINLAGRQRMLSEHIVKDVLVLDAERDPKTRSMLEPELKRSLEDWIKVQRALRNREPSMRLEGQNSPEVERIYDQIEPHFATMADLVGRTTAEPADAARLRFAQDAFLVGMDAIVFQYDQEASQRVQSLQRVGAVLLAILLLTLFLEGFFVFRPAVGALDAAFERLEKYRDHLEMLVSERTEALESEMALHKGTIVKLEDANRMLERAALRDALTELANRRYFDQVLEAEYKRAARDLEPLSLIIVDIDYFKDYNDAFGHVEGDRCLREVAGALQRAVQRPGDVVARYGGEEFAIILPSTGVDGAKLVAERARRLVADLEIESPKRDRAHVTISVGVACFGPSSSLSVSELIAAADAALYDAKRGGRDRVSVRPPAA